MRSSVAAFNLIVEEEVSGQSYYTKYYSHFDYPGDSSGPTIGVGYDLGWVTKIEIRNDWADLIPPDQLALLMTAQGLKGMAASNFVRHNKASVTIPWNTAIAEFKNKEMPKWEVRLAQALPNTEYLSADAFGALVSLAYNRGTGGFSAPGDRYKEMRAIRGLMLSKTFSRIPDQIRSMKRLWHNGLVNRREREAQLFERGIASPEIARLPTRQQIVVDKAALTGIASGGVTLGLMSVTHWAAPLAITAMVAGILASLRWSRHQLVPRAD